jgi:hypothetical protein
MFLHAVICSRAVCAMLSCNPCSQSLKNPECRVPWSRFCIDPWSAAEELHDRGCIKRSKSYLYFHMGTGQWTSLDGLMSQMRTGQRCGQDLKVYL